MCAEVWLVCVYCNRSTVSSRRPSHIGSKIWVLWHHNELVELELSPVLPCNWNSIVICTFLLCVPKEVFYNMQCSVNQGCSKLMLWNLEPPNCTFGGAFQPPIGTLLQFFSAYATSMNRDVTSSRGINCRFIMSNMKQHWNKQSAVNC